MQRVVFATALAGIAAVAVCGTLLAAPSAPLPVAATSDNRPIVQAYYYHHQYYPYYSHGHYYHRRGWSGNHWHYY